MIMSFIDSIHSLAQTVAEGTILFEEGTVGGGIVVLLSGRLKVTKGGVELGTISDAGAYVGESTFVTGKRRNATVTAENSATIIRLTAQQSAEFLQTPEAESKMIRSVTERLSSANEKILESGSRIEELQSTLLDLLKGLAELHEELNDSFDPENAQALAQRKIRVLVNQFGREELVGERIVL